MLFLYLTVIECVVYCCQRSCSRGVVWAARTVRLTEPSTLLDILLGYLFDCILITLLTLVGGVDESTIQSLGCKLQ